METAGLVIGGVSLAGLFTASVDCFEFVQLGRHFGKDYQRSLLKLDIAKLRLSRWGDAMNRSSYTVTVESPTEIEKVKEILGEIMNVFADAEKVSKRFKPKSALDTSVFNPQTDLDADVGALHRRMKELALQRQKRSTLSQKTAWALYEKKHFDRLIEDVTSFVKDLIDLFPALKTSQKELSNEEAQEMQEERGLGLLGEVAEDVDDLFQSAIKATIADRRKHLFAGNIVRDEVIARYGDEYEGNIVNVGRGSEYKENEASGKVTVQYGDHYGVGSVLPSSRRQ